MTQTRNETKKPTIFQSLMTGSVAGAAEVLVDHPLWSIKTRMQSGEPFTLNPSVLYRGILPNAASMIPITALQVGLNRGFQVVFYPEKTDLSNTQQIGSAFLAGMGSSFISCPTEMIMTHQNKNGGGFYAGAKNLMAQCGKSYLWTALPATAMREGLFTTFFLGVTPLLKAKIKPHCANDSVASLAAGMGAGVGATLASQGVDTIKTVQQTAALKQPLNFTEAVTKIYSAQGVQGFFKGSVPRGTRVMSAVTLMGWVNEKMETVFRKPGGGSSP